jgi:hypothetical protein
LSTLLFLWHSLHYSILRLDLTTAVGGDPRLLREHFKVLRKRIERKLKRPLEYWALDTSEGKGVLHTVVASSSEFGSLFIEQGWLSEQWEDIHGARVAWVRRMQGGNDDKKRVARYLVTQYMNDQDAARRVSYSWKRTLGVPIRPLWRQFIESANKGGEPAVRAWRRFLGGEEVVLSGGMVLSLGWVRGSHLHLFTHKEKRRRGIGAEGEVLDGGIEAFTEEI